ncbi:MAG TPA: DUF6338 family protein [Proteiniphilum sp.]|nr:DUF6338 family protein [Proteiniphilum sp.]HPR20701.1 DUF6338 family protein [Proteiniphilum sp.]
MESLTLDKIILIAVFFIPGFIYLKAYRLFIAETNTDFSKDLYEAIGFSFINAIIFSYPIYLINQDNFFNKNALWYFIIIGFIVLITPVVWALIFYLISKKKWFSRYLVTPTKSAWDEFFSKRECYWVIVTLKNGRKIAGKYGMKSIASTYPLPNDIYLEDIWTLNDDNKFGDSIEKNEGILITSNEISTIEFFI